MGLWLCQNRAMAGGAVGAWGVSVAVQKRRILNELKPFSLSQNWHYFLCRTGNLILKCCKTVYCTWKDNIHCSQPATSALLPRITYLESSVPFKVAIWPASVVHLVLYQSSATCKTHKLVDAVIPSLSKSSKHENLIDLADWINNPNMKFMP